MNLVLKSFGMSVAFLMFDAALSIFFDHTINFREKLIDFVIFFVVIHIFNFIAPELRKRFGFEKKDGQM